jgi:uncharacterized protein YndB with AHSA1/START domain
MSIPVGIAGRYGAASGVAGVPGHCAGRSITCSVIAEHEPLTTSTRNQVRSRPAWRTPVHQCLAVDMSSQEEPPRVVTAAREIGASVERVFELIADPAYQPRWDGNENLEEAAPGQRVRAVGDVFTMRLTGGNVRENHVVDFAEGRRIAWRPAEPGQKPPGHRWAWELRPLGPARTLVIHTYDWSELADRGRFARARATTADKLQASLDLLAALAEGPQ